MPSIPSLCIDSILSTVLHFSLYMSIYDLFHFLTLNSYYGSVSGWLFLEMADSLQVSERISLVTMCKKHRNVYEDTPPVAISYTLTCQMSFLFPQNVWG